MTSELQTLEAKVDQALQRIDRLEREREDAVSPWKYLVSRPHPWRRQLAIKGRNMTVGQLLMMIRANRWTAEAASANCDLPLEAIQEALKYGEDERRLIEMEACEERRRVKQRGHALEPQDLPR
jgi:uncharacterized protein (DUF433 family)